MKTRNTGQSPHTIALVSPDAATTKFVSSQLRRVEVFPQIVSTGPRELRKTVADVEEKISTLLLIPSRSLGSGQLKIVHRVYEQGGLVLAWTTDEASSRAENFDDWLLERLLEQSGAHTSPRISVLVEAARFALQGFQLGTRKVRFSGKKNALTGRIASAFNRQGFAFSSAQKDTLKVQVGPDGQMLAVDANRVPSEMTDPRLSAEALGLISQRECISDWPEFVLPDTQMELIETIAKPPPRLLSETTSKRLASYFGISTASERLCESATEATRFASTIEGPVVVKLVRPAFENKMAAGGVHTNVEGPAAIRRAVHGLESLGKRLAPPKPMGVLVAEQISYETPLWLKMLDHASFGRIALVGIGEYPDDNPSFALSAQSSYVQICRVLENQAGIISADDLPRLAETLAKICQMMRVLGKRINRLEMHPLVTLEGHDPPLALDVLIGIGHP